MRRQGYLWATLALFLFAMAGQMVTAAAMGQTWAEFLNAVFENWQSEFLQLCWQVGGMAILLAVGSPQSKEGAERLEAKVDALLGERDMADVVEQLDKEYDRT